MQVILLAAQSVDGRITRQKQAGDEFTSEADKAHFSATLRACDCCVLGRKTYDFSKERLRPDKLPSLRRIVSTRRPADYAADTLPGRLEFTADSPATLFQRLSADGRTRCALLGGGEIYRAWLAAGLVDELCLTLESALFGSGTPLAADLVLPVPLRLLAATTLAPGGPIVLRYAVQK